MKMFLLIAPLGVMLYHNDVGERAGLSGRRD